MKTSPLLQQRRASACTYHMLKSHPVPLGHVTFQNATGNDRPGARRVPPKRNESQTLHVVASYPRTAYLHVKLQPLIPVL